MAYLKLRTRFTLVLSSVGVILLLVAFVIPGWFILETRQYRLDMALWYAVLCEPRANFTVMEMCETVTYSKLVDSKSSFLLSRIDVEVPSMINIQWQVTLSFVLSIASFVIIIYQLNTFHTRTPDRSRHHVHNGHSTKLRARFIYCAGFTGLFQIIAGPLLGVVVYDLTSNYNNLDEPMPIPYTLFLVGIAALLEVLSAINQLLMAFRTKIKGQGRNHHRDNQHNQNDLAQNRLKTPAPDNAGDFNDAEYNGDYYGQDYDPQNPRYHTQGAHKHNSSSNWLFPGYKLGRHNLQGHDKKWWRSVTLASGVK